MNSPFKQMSKGARITFWFVILFVALTTQCLLRLFVAQGVAEYVSGAALASIMSIIFGGLFCKGKNTNQQVESAYDFEAVANVDLLCPSDVADNTSDGGNNDEEEECASTLSSMSTGVDSTAGTHASGNDDANDAIRNEGAQILPQRKRLFYLDNLKIFLTFLVVSHHVTCAFGGCGSGGWILIIGVYDNPFKSFAGCFTLLNQAYFMSLFFFISAYFLPSSYERKGGKVFLFDKAKRYWLPAIFVTAIMAPLVILYCLWFVGGESAYFPTPLHCWFLYWLLVLNLAYVHIRGQRIDECEEDSEETRQELPGPFKRSFVYGLGICGFSMGLVLALLQSGSFCSMPMAPGSLVNDLLFFVAGIVARKHGWLEKNITEQIGMPVSLLRVMVILEAILLCYLFGKMEENASYFIPAMLVAGIFCVDISLALLEFFHTYLDFQNRFIKFFSDAAYTVYIVHPIFVVGVTSAWITSYESYGNTIEWTDLYSSTPIKGGGLTLMVGWLLSNVLVMVLVWPCSWYLRKLPGLCQIL